MIAINPPELILKQLLQETGADWAIAVGFSPATDTRSRCRLLAVWGFDPEPIAGVDWKRTTQSDAPMRHLIARQSQEQIFGFLPQLESGMVRKACDLLGAKFALCGPLRCNGDLTGTLCLLWRVQDPTFSQDQENRLSAAAAHLSELVGPTGQLLPPPNNAKVTLVLAAEVERDGLDALATTIVGIKADQEIVYWYDPTDLFGYNDMRGPQGSPLSVLFAGMLRGADHQDFIEMFLRSEVMIKPMAADRPVPARKANGDEFKIHVLQIRKVPVGTGIGMLALIQPAQGLTMIASAEEPEGSRRWWAKFGVDNAKGLAKTFNDHPIGAMIALLFFVVMCGTGLAWFGKFPGQHRPPTATSPP